MARSGDSLGYYYEEGFIEEGYIRYEPYIEDDYITADYFQEETAITEASATVNSAVTLSIEIGLLQDADASLDVAASQSASVGRIQQGAADFGALFTPNVVVVATKNSTAILDTFASLSATVSPIRDNNIALEQIVNLSLQADRTRLFDTSLSASFDQSSTPNQIKGFEANFTTSTATLTFVPGTLQSGSANFTSTTSQTVETGFLIAPSASYSASTSLTASPISYQLDPLPNNRPNDFVIYRDLVGTGLIVDTTPNPLFDTANPYDGIASARIRTGHAHVSNIEYQIQTDEDFVFETWVRLDDTSVLVVDENLAFLAVGSRLMGTSQLSEGEIVGDKVEDYYRGFAVGLNSAGKVVWKIGTTSGSGLRTTTSSMSQGTWHHIAVTRNNNTVKLYLDNTEIDSTTNSDGFLAGDSTNYVQLLERGFETFWDNTSLRIGASDILGYSNTITQDEFTYVVSTFENTDADTTDLGFTKDYSAELTANATLEANVGATLDATVLYASSGTLTVDANQIFENTVSLDSAFTQNVLTGFVKDAATDFDSIATQISVINKIGNTLVAIDTNASLTADVNEIVQLASDINANFDQHANTNYIVDNTANFSATATLSADAKGGFIGLFDQQLDTATTIEVDNVRVRYADATLVSSTATMSVTATKTTDITESYSSAFTQPAVDYIRFRDTSSNFDAIATQINIINKIGQGLMGFDAIASIDINPTIIAQNEILLEARADQDAVVVKTTDTSADFDANTTLEGAGTTNKLFDPATYNSQFAITVDAVKVTELETEFTAITTVADATAERIRDVDSNLETQVALTADNTRVRLFDPVTYLTVANISANAGILADATVDMGALFTPTIDYRVVHIEQYVYVVPSESRSYTLFSEDKEFTIAQETREYTIL